MTDHYDYWVSYPTTPTFEANIQIMIDRIADNGTSPTITKKTGAHKPAVGTMGANGRTLLHFRLDTEYTKAGLIAYLRSGMIAPLPPVLVESIRNADGTIIEDVVKENFLPFMPQVIIGYDEDENPIYRDAEITDPFILSTYYGSDPIHMP